MLFAVVGTIVATLALPAMVLHDLWKYPDPPAPPAPEPQVAMSGPADSQIVVVMGVR